MRVQQKNWDYLLYASIFGVLMIFSTLDEATKIEIPTVGDLTVHNTTLKQVNLLQEGTIELLTYSNNKKFNRSFILYPKGEWRNLISQYKDKKVSLYTKNKFVWRVESEGNLIISEHDVFTQNTNHVSKTKDSQSSLSSNFVFPFVATLVLWVWLTFIQKKRGAPAREKDKFIFYSSKEKLGFLLVLSLWASLFCLEFLFYSGLLAIILLPLLMLSLRASYVLGKTLASNKPSLILSNEGISLLQSKEMVTFNWCDVQRAFLTRQGFHGFTMVSIILNLEIKQNKKTINRSVNISFLNNSDEIVEVLRRYMKLDDAGYV